MSHEVIAAAAVAVANKIANGKIEREDVETSLRAFAEEVVKRGTASDTAFREAMSEKARSGDWV